MKSDKKVLSDINRRVRMLKIDREYRKYNFLLCFSSAICVVLIMLIASCVFQITVEETASFDNFFSSIIFTDNNFGGYLIVGLSGYMFGLIQTSVLKGGYKKDK